MCLSNYKVGYIFTQHTDMIDLFPKLHWLLYDTPMLQEFRTHTYYITILFPI